MDFCPWQGALDTTLFNIFVFIKKIDKNYIKITIKHNHYNLNIIQFLKKQKRYSYLESNNATFLQFHNCSKKKRNAIKIFLDIFFERKHYI